MTAPVYMDILHCRQMLLVPSFVKRHVTRLLLLKIRITTIVHANQATKLPYHYLVQVLDAKKVVMRPQQRITL
jgi:hypothetical protein